MDGHGTKLNRKSMTTAFTRPALRGYAGCEVLAVSNWLLRRDDQVGVVHRGCVDASAPVRRPVDTQGEPCRGDDGPRAFFRAPLPTLRRSRPSAAAPGPTPYRIGVHPPPESCAHATSMLVAGIDAGADDMLQVLHRIQQFDPVGVGARDLGECLRLQLRALDLERGDLVACGLGLAHTLRLYRPPMNLITTTEDLAEACARLRGAPFIAIHTEFMR